MRTAPFQNLQDLFIYGTVVSTECTVQYEVAYSQIRRLHLATTTRRRLKLTAPRESFHEAGIHHVEKVITLRPRVRFISSQYLSKVR